MSKFIEEFYNEYVLLKRLKSFQRQFNIGKQISKRNLQHTHCNGCCAKPIVVLHCRKIGSRNSKTVSTNNIHYYGNLDPQARSTKQNKTVQKQMEVLMLNEDFLTEHLSGDAKKKFLDFCNAWGVVNGESNLDSFIMGFRLGANFTYDTFVSEESPFTDLLKEA